MSAKDDRGDTTILNVDDNEAGRYAIGRVLQKAGYRVLEAGTGAELMQQLETEQIDLVLMDINLPDANGLELCSRIKADERFKRMPVLHLTATYVMSVDRLEESEADGYLMAPVEPAALLANIRALLRARRAEGALEQEAEEWRSALDCAKVGIAVVDEEGTARIENERYVMLAEDPQASGPLLDLAREALRSRRPRTEIIELEGTAFRAQASPMPSATGEPREAVIVLLQEG